MDLCNVKMNLLWLTIVILSVCTIFTPHFIVNPDNCSVLINLKLFLGSELNIKGKSADMSKVGTQLLSFGLLYSVIDLIKILIEAELCRFLEDHGMRRTSICEMTNMLAFLNFLAFLSRSNAARDFSHS